MDVPGGRKRYEVPDLSSALLRPDERQLQVRSTSAELSG